MDRREFLRRLVMVTVMGAAAASGVVALVQKSIPGQSSAPSLLQVQNTQNQLTSDSSTYLNSTSSTGWSPASTTSSSVPAGYVLLAPLSAVAGKTYAYFNHPTFGSSILINYSGTWRAFSAVCTHAGCTVDFTSSSLYCPCHSGYFSPVNGSVTGGPPSTPLAEFDIKVLNNNLYVSDNRIN